MRKCFLPLLAALIFSGPNLRAGGCADAKPVVLLHGVNSDASAMVPFKEALEKKCPGIHVLNVEIGDGEISSYGYLWDQVETFKTKVLADPLLAGGFNIVAHSQGGAITRAFIQKYNAPGGAYQVDTFITWGSPHRGIYGLPDEDNQRWFPGLVDDEIYRVAYTWPMQDELSLAQLWNDPAHEKDYKSTDNFLPYLNNEKVHPLAATFKANLMNLKKMVLFKSSAEEVVNPPDSCWFDYYQVGGHDTVVKYEATPQYQKDVLGFRTMNEQGRLHFPLVNCSHTDYRTDPQVRDLTFGFLGLNESLYPSLKDHQHVPCAEEDPATALVEWSRWGQKLQRHLPYHQRLLAETHQRKKILADERDRLQNVRDTFVLEKSRLEGEASKGAFTQLERESVQRITSRYGEEITLLNQRLEAISADLQ